MEDMKHIPLVWGVHVLDDEQGVEELAAEYLLQAFATVPVREGHIAAVWPIIQSVNEGEVFRIQDFAETVEMVSKNAEHLVVLLWDQG